MHPEVVSFERLAKKKDQQQHSTGAEPGTSAKDKPDAEKVPSKTAIEGQVKDTTPSTAPSAPAIPLGPAPAKNFFQQCQLFPEPSSGHIETEPYIAAVASLAEFIGSLGLIFYQVRSDVINNTNTVRECYAKNKEANKFLDQLIANEKAETLRNSWWGWESIPPPAEGTTPTSSSSSSVPASTAIEALLWVHRSMAFFGLVLRDLLTDYDAAKRGPNSSPSGGPKVMPREDLSTIFREAYTKTLRPHATWLMNMLFEVMLKGTPTRSQFLATAAGQGDNCLPEAELFGRIRDYVNRLECCNGILQKCFSQYGYVA